jgi:Zn-dependent protease
VNRGWWTIGRLRGAPIRLHWTLPLGALLMGGFSFVPAFWLGFALLILLHELGHALLVLHYGLGLSEIAVHGAGGYCRHERAGSRFEEAALAWGGVAAQALVLLVAEAALWLLGPPESIHTALLAQVFTRTNLWLIFINLLPIEPLDGRKAWPLIGMLWQRWSGRAPGPWGKQRTVEDELRSLPHVDTGRETSHEKTDRIVRDLIARTTQSKSERKPR